MTDVENQLPSNIEAPQMIAPSNDNPYAEYDNIAVSGNQQQTENMGYYPQQYDPNQGVAQNPAVASKSIHDLYVNTNFSEDISSWSNIRNEPSEHVGFWNTAESLTNFSQNATQLHKLNSIFWSSPFFLNLLVLFVLNCCNWQRQLYPDLRGYTLSLPILYTFLWAFLIIVLLVGEQFVPFISVKFGIFINLILHLTFYLIRCKVFWEYIFVWLTFVVLGLFFYVITLGRSKYDAYLTLVVNREVLLKLTFIILMISVITIISVVYVLTLYTSWAYWKNAMWLLQLYLVVSFYNIVCVLGNCTYMTTSYLTAKLYLTGERPTLQDLLAALRRGFVDNIGVACKMSYLLPISEFIHSTARYSPQLTVSELKASYPNVAELILAIAKPIVHIFEVLAKIEMKILKYPQRRAMAYCGIYGISYEEAVHRYCEVSYTKGSSLVDDAYMYDTQLIFKQFSSALACFFIDSTIRIQNYYWFRGFCLGSAFFLLFGLYYTIRTVMRGFLETVFVLFGELPENANKIHPGLYETLKQMYATSVRARNENLDRNSALLTQITTDYQNL
ncbi:hypothetical protein TVAG_016470 [Trichomonas vaginalis G3]|uniref:Choline transporter-like protein n=1 Tax=Trichomonas vaginalis (strain ATCC PRA-98 / G3) TaxID=412133 RepID=A2DPB7_TRIV3|nr:choline transporter-like (SLC family 44) family [Trichomonas vaginalis G3]EAY17817.1 hypothetical protein TVAG_016470 [Trichomonas vaginalis G3]KAI5484340.1 choline transporter-like (SLC family 44) family [Trichomonas vaginalis G3]|eukprot:XP_001329952.1 hypothetical protein [Trichomonas vaginalis G3]